MGHMSVFYHLLWNKNSQNLSPQINLLPKNLLFPEKGGETNYFSHMDLDSDNGCKYHRMGSQSTKSHLSKDHGQ
ncbi:hypothetical protein FKM82_021973 [Ascaphus truei]